jgi:hypothetical protein
MAPPKALPVILAVTLPLIFSLALAPLFGAVANPGDNIGRLEVLVASFDGPASPVAAALTAGVAALKASGAPVPTFTVLSAADAVSPDALRLRVTESEVWGCIYVAEGAGASLLRAWVNASSDQDYLRAYKPAAAMKFVWDEARNNQVSPRVSGAGRALLARVVAGLSAALVNQTVNGPGGAAALGAVAAVRPDVVREPASYTEDNVAPFDVPIIATSQLIGNILMAVFGMVICNVVMGPLGFFINPIPQLWKRLVARFVATVFYGGMIAIAFATMVVGLANRYATGAERHYTGSGMQWAQIWTLSWLQLLIFAFFFIAAHVGTKPPLVPLFLLFAIIWNVLAGFNTDLADTGYRFYWGWSVFHGAIALKHVVFGTGSDAVVSRSVGILFLWLFVDVGLFVGAHLLEAKKAAAAKLTQTPAGGAEGGGVKVVAALEKEEAVEQAVKIEPLVATLVVSGEGGK